ncbi:pyridoxal phosphate-dependent decarboxylase family protein [Virgibacillus doumboii]|uniref:pyridoxal phosphate-dependent decarboxylase family protein n=1 Tax=Virgibacillus doumboii TaxID=2697503 RepID=UPI0013E02F6F|nr:aspartate aminotransferase family protein [Virgibacillus doumboii]
MEKKETILQQLKELQQEDLNPKGGNVWAYVYDSGLRKAQETAIEAYNLFIDHNGLDFTVFPSLLKLENEIVDEIAGLFSNDKDTLAGTFTSGGTESIMLAVKAARDYAGAQKPEITAPEIILPNTAHAAFHKAAHYLGINTVIVPVSKVTFKVDPAEVEKQITPNTIMLVGSSVNYSHGVSDPIEELSELAVEHDIWLHVDACIGGFLLAYYRKLGHNVNPFDFHLPGVSSLSVDLHKYAFTPKGASVILYRNKNLRQYQYYACTNWTGYPVINTTIQSTKSGGPLAACWATLKSIGDDGYRKLAAKIWETKQEITKRLENMDDLYILGEPEVSLLALGSDTIDIFQLADEMKKAGWYIQVQPGDYDMQPSIHLTITPVNKIDAFFLGLEEAILQVKTYPRHSLKRAAVSIADTSEVTPDTIASLLHTAGVKPDGSLPDDMASVNELLHLLPHEITKEAFLHITNELFTPKKSFTEGDE